MAETKRRGRPPKSATVQVKKEVEKKEVSQEDIIKQLMEQLAEQNAKMAEMQKQIEELKNNHINCLKKGNSCKFRHFDNWYDIVEYIQKEAK